MAGPAPRMEGNDKDHVPGCVTYLGRRVQPGPEPVPPGEGHHGEDRATQVTVVGSAGRDRALRSHTLHSEFTRDGPRVTIRAGDLTAGMLPGAQAAEPVQRPTNPAMSSPARALIRSLAELH